MKLTQYRRCTAATVFFLLLCPTIVTAGHLKIGDHAPDWMLQTAKGNSISFYEDSSNKPSVLLFWATWCPFCQALMPELEALRKELPSESVNFYALNILEDGDPVTYMEKKGYSFRLLLMAEGVAKHYGVKGTPGLFVIDKNKKVLFIRQRGSKPASVIRSVRKSLANSLINSSANSSIKNTSKKTKAPAKKL